MHLWNDDPNEYGLVQLATLWVQDHCNVSLLTQKWEFSIDGWYDTTVWREGSYIKAYRSMFGGRTLIGDILNVGGVGRVGAIYLPRPPVATVDLIQYFDQDGVLQTLANTVYQVDTYNKPGRVALGPFQIWPFPQIGRVQDCVRIQATTGWATVGEMCQQWPGARMAILYLVSHWFSNPDAVAQNQMSEIPFALREMLDSFNFNIDY